MLEVKGGRRRGAGGMVRREANAGRMWRSIRPSILELTRVHANLRSCCNVEECFRHRTLCVIA